MVTFIEKLPQLRKNIIVQSLGKGGKCIEIAKWAQKSRLGSRVHQKKQEGRYWPLGRRPFT